MAKIFISHSWEDNDFSKKLAALLGRDGAEIWIDYARIFGGDSLPVRIGQAIEWCDIMILVWSAAAAKSYYVELEWSAALNNKKRIIPCILDSTKPPTILTGFLYVDMINFAVGYESLARGLKLPIQSNKTPRPGKIETGNELLNIKINSQMLDYFEPPIFRSKPIELSSTEVIDMLKKNDFYESFNNSKGLGFPQNLTFSNNSELLEITSQRVWL